MFIYKNNYMVERYMQACGYSIPILKNHIFIFNDTEIKKLTVDIGLDYSDLGYNPFILTASSVSYSEETSFDERYRFDKTLTIIVNEKADIDKLFQHDRFYVIVEDLEGNFYMTNPDFQYSYVYSYNLSEGQNQTTITLQSPSNYPLLAMPYLSINHQTFCNAYDYIHIEKLQLIEYSRARWSNNSYELNVTEPLKEVQFNKDSLSFQEQYNGDKITSTLSFSMPLKSFNSSWPYNLLEFKDNRYIAIISLSNGKQLLAGINEGLEPYYNINGNSTGDSTVDITLMEYSNSKSIYIQSTVKELLGYEWVYVTQLNGHKTYLCNYSNGGGWAEIWVMVERDNFGNNTGNVKILKNFYDGLYGPFEDGIDYSFWDFASWIKTEYNVVGYFETDYPNNWFPTNECVYYNNGNNGCQLNIEISTFILQQKKIYSLSIDSSNAWEITDINNISISKASGQKSETINVQGLNVGDASFKISNGCKERTYYFTVKMPSQDLSCILSSNDIILDGRAQTYDIIIDKSCFEGVQYSLYPYEILSNGNIRLSVPRYDGLLDIRWPQALIIKCCQGTKDFAIARKPLIQSWKDNGIICENGIKYIREELYIGDDINDLKPTNEYRKGEILEQNSYDCSNLTRYTYFGNNICLDGDEYKILEEEYSVDYGATWTKTSKIALGDYVDENDEAFKGLCSQTPTIKWVLTDEWICEE